MRQASLSAGFLALFSTIITAVVADSTFEPLRPPAIPLAVRSPYLHTWLNGDSGGNLAGSWPRFWANHITAWQGFVRVDGVTYNWMGAAPGPALATQTSFQYTSTQSIFTFDVAGKINLTATFLSPVYPDDLLMQSLQYSYLQVSVESTDGAGHNVQLYSDVSGEWASASATDGITWDYDEDKNGLAYHQFELADAVEFQETSDMARWGTWYFGTGSGDGLTYQNGVSDVTTRTQFAETGTLGNTKSSDFRNINHEWPVFAFSKDLGFVHDTSEEVLFVIGVAQDHVVNYKGASSTAQALSALWTTKYATGEDALVDFYHGWADALAASETLDSRIQTDAQNDGGDNYAALATLAVRQTFGSLQVAHGTSQDYIFLKEISSNGDCSTVDVIFPAHPILLYLNPTLLKLLLDPLYEYQEGGSYPNKWSIHDLGTFPNALGYDDGNDESMPVEECGNMIIMTLAYAQHSNDNAYLSKHWARLEQWAQFLVDDSLIPDNQLSTDDFLGTLANQTNLALKGIIGIRAMSEIATRVSAADASKAIVSYNDTAVLYMNQWLGLGIASDVSPPHATLQYGHSDTHGLLYNLYADRLLGLDLVPQSVYDMQSAFYETVMQPYGLALDTRHPWAKSDWEMFTAAIASPSVKATIVQRLVDFVKATPAYRPMTDLYDVTTADFAGGITFTARPVVGGLFAPLALSH